MGAGTAALSRGSGARGAAADRRALGRHLRRASLAGYRGKADAFHGREDVFARLMAMARRDPAAADRILLIEGGPGAGKTALLGEAGRRLAAAGVPARVLAQVPRGRQVARLRARLAALGGQPSSAPRRPRLAVLIDEIQRLAPRGAGRDLVVALGRDRALPVLLVCAGVPGSGRALARAGLAELADPVVLGPLSAAQAFDRARGAFDNVRGRGVGGSAADAECWAAAVAAASQGWPRHLACHLAACWEVLAGQDRPSLASDALEAALRRGAALSGAYPREGRLRPLVFIRRRLQA